MARAYLVCLNPKCPIYMSLHMRDVRIGSYRRQDTSASADDVDFRRFNCTSISTQKPNYLLLSTYYHLENLVAHATKFRDYNCFESLLRLARNTRTSSIPAMYGTTRFLDGNHIHYYIEAQIHAQVSFERDIQAICYSKLELNRLSETDQTSLSEYLLRLRSRFGIELIEVP